MSQRINCLCIDTSQHSQTAFDWYVKNFHRDGDTLALLHIFQMPQLPTLGLTAGSIPITDDYRTSIRNNIEASNALIESFTNRCKENNMDFKVIKSESHHSPGQVICDLAKENNAATIILGQRGLSKFSRVLLGSTSDYVLHHADLPVIVIPPQE